MKLYSKTRLVIVACVSSVLVAILTAVICLNLPTKKSNLVSVSAPSNEQTKSQNSAENEANVDSNFVNTAISAISSNADGFTQDEIQNIGVYEKYASAVVNISTQVIQYNWFFEAYPSDGGIGSGAIIDKRGYVITNRHVIKDAYKIYISLADGTQYEGSLVGEDFQTDIAVVKFTPPSDIELTVIPFADSSKLHVGQKVIAIGNPFGFDRTMTTGIISSLGRPIQSNDTVLQDMIQTDTAINPGNSGGPLLDSQGRMIGINTMIYSSSGSSAGVGFAVPVNTAKRITSDLMRYGKVKRGSLNISAVPINGVIARYGNIPVKEGILVSEVQKGSNADKAGLRGGTEAVRFPRSSQIFYLGGDVITEINGKKCTSAADYNSALESTKPGETVTLKVLRNKKTSEIKVVLEERQ